jgi:DNA mismatch repair protein MutL
VVRESREVAIGGRTYQKIQQLGLRERLVSTPPSRISNSGQYQAITPTVPQKQAASLPVGWRLAGYIYNTYILFDTPEGLKFVEQHIAHERLIYERILAQQEQPGRISQNVQRLVISAPLNLTPTQRACLAENLEQLKDLGFDFDFQPNYIGCTQVPLELATKDYVGTVQNIVEQIFNCDNAEFSLEATKSIACQAAIKNGMGLTETEIVDLVSEWYACPRNNTCPHGRPVSLTYSKDKLFELFHPK